MTEAERILWEKLRRRGLGLKVYRQHPLFHDTSGLESFFIADFYCHSERMVIELDGEIHESRTSEDAERTEILKLLGLRVLRFTNEEVLHDLPQVLRRIRQSFGNTIQIPLPSQGRG